MKIERTCPRCRAHRNHWLDERKPLATCAECSHSWRIRLDADERADQKAQHEAREHDRALITDPTGIMSMNLELDSHERDLIIAALEELRTHYDPGQTTAYIDQLLARIKNNK